MRQGPHWVVGVVIVVSVNGRGDVFGIKNIGAELFSCSVSYRELAEQRRIKLLDLKGFYSNANSASPWISPIAADEASSGFAGCRGSERLCRKGKGIWE